MTGANICFTCQSAKNAASTTSHNSTASIPIVTHDCYSLACFSCVDKNKKKITESEDKENQREKTWISIIEIVKKIKKFSFYVPVIESGVALLLFKTWVAVHALALQICKPRPAVAEILYPTSHLEQSFVESVSHNVEAVPPVMVGVPLSQVQVLPVHWRLVVVVHSAVIVVPLAHGAQVLHEVSVWLDAS